MKKDALIIVRGAGDLATGTIHRLWAAGFRVLAFNFICKGGSVLNYDFG